MAQRECLSKRWLSALFKPRGFRGNTTIFTIGSIFVSTMFGAIAVDLPMYYTYQNQLQTAVDAAALAGASALPGGQGAAEAHALEVAQMNMVAGDYLSANDLSFSYTTGSQMSMEVVGTTQAPTLFNRFLCGMKSALEAPPEDYDGDEGEMGSSSTSCDFMNIAAGAKAIPSARDTMLVIDNSSSMNSNNRMNSVKNAADDYVDEILNLDIETADRIGLVRFAHSTDQEEMLLPLKGLSEDSDFSNLKYKISTLKTYYAKGWNTDYEAGMQPAIEELINNGRPNANKNMIFLTDGLPNQPAPPDFYDYEEFQPYDKCVDMVHQDVWNNYRNEACSYNWRRRRWSCPTLPSSKIKDYMISEEAHQCGLEYVDYMEERIMYWTDEASDNDITIHVITIAPNNAVQTSYSIGVLKRLIKDPDWDPSPLLNYMADSTDGNYYADDSYDPQVIASIYTDIAKNVRVRLAGN